MKIFVLIKQVPDTETRVKLDGKGINESNIKWIISPFDEHAIEEAILQKAKTQAETTVITLGPSRCVSALRTAFAMGIENGVHIQDDSYNVLNTSYTAAILAAYLKQASPDIVFTGHTAIDSQSAIVPSMIAQHLGISNINNAVEVNVKDTSVEVKREFETGLGIISSPLPVVISAAKSLNNPRYPSLKGIMSAKKKEIKVVEASSLGLENTNLHIEIESLELPPPRPPGRVIEADDSQGKASILVKALREEAKVI